MSDTGLAAKGKATVWTYPISGHGPPKKHPHSAQQGAAPAGAHGADAAEVQHDEFPLPDPKEPGAHARELPGGGRWVFRDGGRVLYRGRRAGSWALQ